MGLTTKTYKTTSGFPQLEQFGLTSQIRFSTVSVPSNIAESFGRNSKNEFTRFLRISMGSLFELQTQFEISINLKFITENTFIELSQDATEVEKILKALIKSLKK